MEGLGRQRTGIRFVGFQRNTVYNQRPLLPSRGAARGPVEIQPMKWISRSETLTEECEL